ncbi:hypothetical protein H7F43_15170, partial [Streptococcus sp. SPC0]|nr:hypothetical protein [Streptococcus sp. SPC0]
EALRLVQQGLRKNSFDGQLLLLASQLSYELHDVSSSESYLKQAEKVSENQDEIVMRLSNLYLEEERFEEVLELDNDDLENILAKWNIAKAHKA